MPFIQRVVQPITLAQNVSLVPVKITAAKTNKISKFLCMRNNCENPNCIIKQKKLLLQQSQEPHCQHNENECCYEKKSILSIKDTSQQNEKQEAIINLLTKTKSSSINSSSFHNVQQDSDFKQNLKDNFTTNVSYDTDTDDDIILPLKSPSLTLHERKSPIMPIKKLKHHIEFLSTGPSPVRSLTRNDNSISLVGNCCVILNERGNSNKRKLTCAPQSLPSTKVIAGYEFDSISNITLSNALRQLASLVLIASDIFDDLQLELISFGERTRNVQRKIVSVEKQVGLYDPKTITVPESDLFTFAHRKSHFQSVKKFCNELFTVETRPSSVQILYKDAAKKSSPLVWTLTSYLNSHMCDGIDSRDSCGDDVMSYTDDINSDVCNELLSTSIFGKNNLKMRKRIDADIEIRLPAAIEDLRKWTSAEALGDVTVTPDCMHHVDTLTNSSGLFNNTDSLPPPMSASIALAINIDSVHSKTANNSADNLQHSVDLNKDVPLNHRLPSPEEQCKIIALRYPAQVISVDTSGKRFQRMCIARKSTTGYFTNIDDSNNLNDNIQTVNRHSRSRKTRSKRRNTIAGLDHKEIQDAASGNVIATEDESKNLLSIINTATTDVSDVQIKRSVDSKKFGRSKSSDLLKKDSAALLCDKGKNTLTRLNSLKQWGLNRFKFMQRHETTDIHTFNVSENQNRLSGSLPITMIENAEKTSNLVSSLSDSAATTTNNSDENRNIHQLIKQRSEGRFAHERKPSYSSSEKSMNISNSGHLRGKLNLVPCGNVKLRDTSSLNRQRRNGMMSTGLYGKDDQPHSSSGNWSASSESGRTSIGSEITIQPKSSASNTSLNISNCHAGSGPPSSMMSRRKFLNTSASSSVTSEGTATPEFHVADSAYPNLLDDETSSAYSCDTEGYYTSFHMDSGLRTLKEEEPTLTPLQSGQNLQTNANSFIGLSNQCNLSAENEYELFGKGSTSTTTSSAGTVCTTLVMNGERSSLNSFSCPEVPERISSLGKLSKCNHSNNTSSSTLEGSYSSSTLESTLERPSTIKRNVKTEFKLINVDNDGDNCFEKGTEQHKIHEKKIDLKQHGKCGPQILPETMLFNECEWSESSDLEGVERIERIKQKTTINATCIPSMCIITPNSSDDENHTKEKILKTNISLSNESSKLFEISFASKELQKSEKEEEINVETQTNTHINDAESCKINKSCDKMVPSGNTSNNVLKNTKDQNLNILKNSLSNDKINVFKKLEDKFPNKNSLQNNSVNHNLLINNINTNSDLYDIAGEYVTIADLSNNNRQNKLHTAKTTGLSNLGIYYSNDTIGQKNKNVAKKSKDNEVITQSEVIYISLNDLPHHLHASSTNDYNCNTGKNMSNNSNNMTTDKMFNANTSLCKDNIHLSESNCADSKTQNNSIPTVPMYADISDLQENFLVSQLSQQKCSLVHLNSQGKIIYDSDSYERQKGSHTTFLPGPFVKESEGFSFAIDDTTAISCQNSITTQNGSENFTPLITQNNLTQNTTAIKLLKKCGILKAKKIANVRPIVTKTSLCQQNIDNCKTTEEITFNNTTKIPKFFHLSIQNDETTSSISHNMKSAGNILETNSNLFFNESTSPTTKSSLLTDADRLSITDATSSLSQDEDYLRLCNIRIEDFKQRCHQDVLNSKDTSIHHYNPIYWTMQNERQQKPALNEFCRDDLYATPTRRAERTPAKYTTSITTSSTKISQIGKRTCNGFNTLENTKVGVFKENYDKNAERVSTCADRIGQSKTSLMDFKKLLLAKSSKKSPMPKKISAVELLKKNNQIVDTVPQSDGYNQSTPPLNLSMKIMDLNGSPKTFANRRMLRQGHFGSPSKSFSSKLKSNTSSWRDSSVPHTDVMSIIIPEANSDEDQINTTEFNSSIKNIKISELPSVFNYSAQTLQEKFDIKRNFFVQADENNFMRGELKHIVSSTSTFPSKNAKKYKNEILVENTLTPDIKTNADENDFTNTDSRELIATTEHQKTALETAL